MRQPAHDQAVLPDHLHAIDTEVLAFLVRPARDHQRPGDQRACIARPAGLHRQHAEVYIVFLENVLLTLAAPDHLRCHGEHLLEDRELVPGIAHALRRVGLAQEGEQLAHLAQFRGGAAAHAERHALFGAEEIGEQGHLRAAGLREEQRRAARAERPVADLGNLETRVHRRVDAFQLSGSFQRTDELAQIAVLHGARPLTCASWRRRTRRWSSCL